VKKIKTLATSTLENFLHNRLLLLVLILALCLLTLMLFPLLAAKSRTTGENQQAMASMVLELISQVMSFSSGLGTLLAAWGAADAFNTELKSGTVLAIMARPVKRWEFLLGKYLGVMLFMGCYVLVMLALSYGMASLAGVHIQASPLVLIFYPMVRYAIYAAIAMFFATLTNTIATMGAIFVIAMGIDFVTPRSPAWMPKLAWLKTTLYYVLPSTNLLTEDRFLSLRQASLKQATWQQHAISLAYGLDFALIVLLFAMWSFHYRTLRED
jgi:ABC-type transport system involved in multi-copper enzyme maturation permease subunit